jgi:prolyl-tRNA editing enzyme YbaK/EbsC (Cys-tRNA(Pro) deacylase)
VYGNLAQNRLKTISLPIMHSHESLQKLDIIEADQLADHLPAQVIAHLPPNGVVVFAVSDDASDTAAFSERYGFGLEDCANTIVIRYRKDGGEHYAAIVTLGSLRLDINGAVKAHLGAQRLSFARREVAVEHSGMEFGGITAFGLPDDWRILVDAAVMEREQVVMGAGVRVAKLLLPPAVLRGLPNCEVAQLTLPAE